MHLMVGREELYFRYKVTAFCNKLWNEETGLSKKKGHKNIRPINVALVVI